MVIFGSAWLMAAGLYALHLSLVLIYPTTAIIRVVSWIVVPFVLTVLMYLGGYPLFALSPRRLAQITEGWLERRLKIAFLAWAGLTAVEIVYSGGIPIVWLFQGTGQSYVDFGIPSFHGLLNSLLLTIGLSGFTLFAVTGRKRHLWMPGFVIAWSIIAVTRNMLIVILMECIIVWAMIRRVTWRKIAKGLVPLLVLVLVFGYVGDMRTGIDRFRQLADPSPNYPDWLPSGVLWIYIYVSTPINNLVNTVRTTAPLNSALFPNTTALLVPTVLREVIYNPATISNAVSGELVDEGSWNVSTAYVGAFQDFGTLGIACFSLVLGAVAAHFWRDHSLRGSLVYAVVGQCLAISVFFNHLFYLPVISQVVWLYLLVPKFERVDRRGQRSEALTGNPVSNQGGLYNA
ncbi:MAG: O-antigen polymerase [Terracidiphilus sp.]